MRDRYVREFEGPPSKKARLQPLTANTKVLIQSQPGTATLRWDKTGIVMEILPSDQYTVKVNGSNRLVKRDRKLLRACVPALEEGESRSLHSLDRDSDGESDSACGARGHVTWSADPNNEPGGTVAVERTWATAAMKETSRPEASNPPQKVDRRRLSRVSKGKTTRF